MKFRSTGSTAAAQRRLSLPVALLLALVVTALSIVPAEARTLVHAGRLIDGTEAAVRDNVTIIVEDDRIVAIEDGFQTATEGDKVVDLRQLTVLPGLMDMHTHLTMQLSPTSYAERTTLDPADLALQAAVYARVTLEAGFTTVRDLGDTSNVSIALKRAITRGITVGPRIFTAGKALGTTGGHADPTNGLSMALRGDPGPAEGVVNGPADAAKAVRQRYKDGADLIKITATGGVLSVARNGQNPQFSEEELRAIVETANDYDFHVTAHAHGKEGMLRAIRAGVRSIEHGTYMDDEVMTAMKQHRTYFVPTISAGKWVAMLAEQDGMLPEVVRPKAAAIGPVIVETFRKAHAAGVAIAFGTDSGVSPHGDNAKEFEYMVEGGMSPAETIRAATRTTAELLGIEDDLGSIETGKLADLIAVAGDPLEDVRRLQSVVFVMKDGVVYKSDG